MFFAAVHESVPGHKHEALRHTTKVGRSRWSRPHASGLTTADVDGISGLKRHFVVKPLNAPNSAIARTVPQPPAVTTCANSGRRDKELATVLHHVGSLS